MSANGSTPTPAKRFRTFLNAALLVLGIMTTVFVLQKKLKPAHSTTQDADQPSLPSNGHSALEEQTPDLESKNNLQSNGVQSALDTAMALVTGSPPLTSADLSTLVALLNDDSQPLKTRRQAARNLARLGNLAAVQALAQSLPMAPPYLKAAIGESLGEINHPQARQILIEMLTDDDEVAIRGAIRGLAAHGNLAAVDVLESFLRDASKSESVRSESALALGGIRDPNAFRALALAALELENETVKLYAIQGLGQRPLAETQEFLRGLLETPETSQEMRTEILSSLADSPDDPHAFLLDYIGHADPEIRAAAALAMSQADVEGQAGPDLLDQLSKETDLSVRLRLYQALGNQTAYDLSLGMALVESEPDLALQLEGYRILATSLRREESAELLGRFDQQAVPLLRDAALSDLNLHTCLVSVMALSQVKTASSMAALEEITRRSTDPKVAEAAQIGLQRSALR